MPARKTGEAKKAAKSEEPKKQRFLKAGPPVTPLHPAYDRQYVGRGHIMRDWLLNEEFLTDHGKLVRRSQFRKGARILFQYKYKGHNNIDVLTA